MRIESCTVMWMYHEAIIPDDKIPNLPEDYMHQLHQLVIVPAQSRATWVQLLSS